MFDSMGQALTERRISPTDNNNSSSSSSSSSHSCNKNV